MNKLEKRILLNLNEKNRRAYLIFRSKAILYIKRTYSHSKNIPNFVKHKYSEVKHYFKSNSISDIALDLVDYVIYLLKLVYYYTKRFIKRFRSSKTAIVSSALIVLFIFVINIFIATPNRILSKSEITRDNIVTILDDLYQFRKTVNKQGFAKNNLNNLVDSAEEVIKVVNDNPITIKNNIFTSYSLRNNQEAKVELENLSEGLLNLNENFENNLSLLIDATEYVDEIIYFDKPLANIIEYKTVLNDLKDVLEEYSYNSELRDVALRTIRALVAEADEYIIIENAKRFRNRNNNLSSELFSFIRNDWIELTNDYIDQYSSTKGTLDRLIGSID